MPRKFNSDPRKELPSQQVTPEILQAQASPDLSASHDPTEEVLLGLLLAFTPRVPSHAELLASPNLPYILCGQQQVMDVVRGLLVTHRKEVNRG